MELREIMDIFVNPDEPKKFLKARKDILTGKVERDVFYKVLQPYFSSGGIINRSNLRAINTTIYNFFKEFAELELPNHDFLGRNELIGMLKKLSLANKLEKYKTEAEREALKKQP